MPPKPTATNNSPNQLLTKKESARFTSVWARAIREATRAVAPPTATRVVCTKGLNTNRGSRRNSTQAPPSTTTELRRMVEGKGLSMASSSQRCRGIWAHLPMGPATRANRIRLRLQGKGPEIPWAQLARPWKFQVPVSGRIATRPANSTKSPIRLVRKASRAPLTTKGWLYQVPTTR